MLWGDEEILDSDEFKNNGYIGFKDQNEMFKVAPRSAEHSFTLTQNGYEYCLIVIEEGCNRIVKINDNVIYDRTSENTCFIVDPNSKVTVDGNDKNLSSGNLYYVKNNQD